MSHQDPAPALLLSLIEDDKAQELQSHLFDETGMPMQVGSHHLDFWNKQWPQLVRHAAACASEKSLRLLCMFKPPPGQALPPLPSLTLACLLKGFEQHSRIRTFSGFAPEAYDVVVARLSASPITLRTEDGVRLVRMGGPSVVFSSPNIDESPSDGLFESPTFQAAWHKWCASSSHRAQALPLLNAQESYLARLSTMRAIVDQLPPVTKAGYLNDLCGLLEKKGGAQADEPEMVQVMLAWQGQFVRSEWALEHPLWGVWGSRLCHALENAPRTPVVMPVTNVGASWTTATLRESALSRSECFPGWRWTPAMREGLAHSRGNLVSYALTRHQKGLALSDHTLTQAGAFLRQTLQTEVLMERWGLGDASTRRHMDTAIREVLGESWEDQFDKILQEHRALSPTAHTHWAAWKARRLELDWAESAVPGFSGRPRM